MFEELYESAWQHPVALWAAAALGLALALARRGLPRRVRAGAAALAALSAVDAWLTSPEVPGLGALPAAAATITPVVFVIVGDARVLVLRAWATPAGLTPTARGLLAGLAWALVVPVLSQLVVCALDDPRPRVLFLVYEVSFLALLLLRARWQPPAGRWARWLDRVAVAWYASWLLADVVILGLGSDAGFLLRVVPNLLYYGALPPALAFGTPARAGPA